MGGEALDILELNDQAGSRELTFGVYHTPKDFVRQTLFHLFDESYAVEDLTRQNVFELLTKGAMLQFARLQA